MAWQKPKDNGGSEITSYIVEKMEVDSGQWIPVGEVLLFLDLFCTPFSPEI